MASITSAPQSPPLSIEYPESPVSTTDRASTCDPEKTTQSRNTTESTLLNSSTDSSRDVESCCDRSARPGLVGRVARAITGLSSHEKPKGKLDSQCIDFHADGYPRLAAYLNSDENFLIARRYGFLHTRVLLYRQDELRELEENLQDLDKEDDKDEDGQLCLQSRDVDDAREPAERAELINKIDKKLEEYDSIVLRARSMASLPKATNRNYNSVKNFVINNKPLAREDAEFLDHDQDFVALVDEQEGGWFDALIEHFLGKVPGRVTRMMFSEPAQRNSTSDKYVRLYSKQRIDTFARIIITFLAVVLLMAPVVVLFRQQESGAVKIGVILLFTLVFSAALAVFTNAKRHEVFAATAAYCAVLVVFLGNFQS